MRKLPPLTQLRAFEAVARHLSFKAAAAELSVTPTAISHQIHALEEFCGVQLLRRRPRPVSLTPAGADLYPVLRQGFDAFESALDDLIPRNAEQTLVVTTTNAFASRWLVPRLPSWRSKHPGIQLEVIGTDAVIDLAAGQADVAIRYMYDPPQEMAAIEVCRDEFYPVCSPSLLPGGKPIEHLQDLAKHTLIHCYWSPSNPHAPTWSRWLGRARAVGSSVPKLSDIQQLTFREELHAIDAAVAEQGIIIVSSLLVARELEDGRLVKAVDISLPGFGFYLVQIPNHARQWIVDLFSSWAMSMVKPDSRKKRGGDAPP